MRLALQDRKVDELLNDDSEIRYQHVRLACHTRAGTPMRATRLRSGARNVRRDARRPGVALLRAFRARPLVPIARAAREEAEQLAEPNIALDEAFNASIIRGIHAAPASRSKPAPLPPQYSVVPTRRGDLPAP